MPNSKSIIQYLSRQYGLTRDPVYRQAVSIVAKANPGKAHSPSRRNHDTWDRWANGNQYRAFNSDD